MSPCKYRKNHYEAHCAGRAYAGCEDELNSLMDQGLNFGRNHDQG
ncbi:hypothetical protein EKH55_5620 (plasmid) [Sinorhizobium alkalisoli]|nr:hypothetical protein EKH55_5620 [Sinorhizobium alkalisoli]